MTLAQSRVKKSENLHIMRFLASLAVVFSHAYPIANTNKIPDPLDRITNNEISIGGLCVTMFFLCSGYLISKSVVRSKNFISYIKARLVRLIPPLAFVVVFSVVVGAFFTTLSAKEYFSSIGTYKYLLNAVLLTNYELPGVFVNTPYGACVNGALWTLRVEFLCYIVCYVMYKLKFLQKKLFWITIPVAIAAIGLKFMVPNKWWFAIRPCLIFYIGMLYFVYSDKIKLKSWMIPIALGLFMASLFNKYALLATLFTVWPYLLFVVWFGIKQCPKIIGSLGELSYTVYLWGFFVQQVVICLFGEMSVIKNTVISSAIAIVLAVATYLITEKPFVKRKNKTVGNNKEVTLTLAGESNG